MPRLVELENLLFENALGEKIIAHEMKVGEAWVEDELKGYVLYRRDGDLVDILRLGVDPVHHGKGIGRSLLEKVLRESEQVMLTVKKDNARALKIYRVAGFEIVAHLQAAHAWVMRWSKNGHIL